MAPDERHRHALYEAARTAMGDDAAATLMESLPPVGWSELATKQDLESLGLRLDTRLERELRVQTGRYVTWMIALFTANIAATAAIVGIAE